MHVGINYFGTIWRLMKEEAGKISNPTTNNDHASLCGRKIAEGKIHEKLGHQLSHGVQAYDKMTA